MKKIEDPKEVKLRYSVRVTGYDMDKIIRIYGSFTNYVNAMILLNIRGQK